VNRPRVSSALPRARTAGRAVTSAEPPPAPPEPARAPARLGARIHGLRIGLRSDHAALLRRLAERLPRGWRRAAGGRPQRLYTLVADGRGERALYADGALLARGRRLPATLDAFESDVQLHVAEWAPRRVFVHAGAVGWRGRAIIVPGRSLSGKSTLVRELVRAGATYYSDEYAVLDARGRLHPFARPLALRTARGTRRRVRPESLAARIGVRPLPVGLVVVTRYRAGARWRPRRLSPSAGALALLANTVSVRREPTAAMTAVQAVVLQAVILQGVRGEAREVARALLDLAGGANGTPPGAGRPRPPAARGPGGRR
jgi:hypothetical protein